MYKRLVGGAVIYVHLSTTLVVPSLMTYDIRVAPQGGLFGGVPIFGPRYVPVWTLGTICSPHHTPMIYDSESSWIKLPNEPIDMALRRHCEE